MPPLRELEAQVFQQLFQYMWSSVLMEGATADQLPGAVAKQWIMQPSKEEECVQRWIDAFQVYPPPPPPPSPLPWWNRQYTLPCVTDPVEGFSDASGTEYQILVGFHNLEQRA